MWQSTFFDAFQLPVFWSISARCLMPSCCQLSQCLLPSSELPSQSQWRVKKMSFVVCSSPTQLWLWCGWDARSIAFQMAPLCGPLCPVSWCQESASPAKLPCPAAECHSFPGPSCPVSCCQIAASPAKLPCQAAGCQVYSQMKQLLNFSFSNSPPLLRHVWVFWAFLTSL